MNNIKCIGIKDRKNPHNVILKIIEPPELKGKIAFPRGFKPKINEEYLCEIVKNYPRYCFVKLHQHEFKNFKPSDVFIFVEPMLQKLRVKIELEYSAKCVCGEVKCKNEERFIDVEPTLQGLEKAKQFIRSLNLPENIKQRLINDLVKEFEKSVNIVYLCPDDEKRLLKIYEKKALELAREARFPYWRIEVLKKSLTETRYRVQLLGDGRKLLEVTFDELWHDGFGEKYKLIPPTTRDDFLLFYTIKKHFIPFIKVEKSEFEKALESIKPLSEEEKKVQKVFELWEREVFERRKKIVAYELKIRFYNRSHSIDETVTVKTPLPSELLNIKVCYETKIAIGEEPAWLLPDTVYATLLTPDSTLKIEIEEREIETSIDEISKLCERMKNEVRITTSSGRIVVIKPKTE